MKLVSETAAWLVLAVTLVLGVPLFVCMPLWVDATLYDVAARTILGGGVHYRDLFETNLPGMLWLQTPVRSIVGWSSEALRGVDLCIVGASVIALILWLRRIGVPRSSRVWLVTGCTFFYIFETEFIHCQRDGWMLLPTVLALHVRTTQLMRAGESSAVRVFTRGMIEGVFWACAVWIKPHCIVPALFVWLISTRRLAGHGGRKLIVDFVGLLTGGLLIGGAGSYWLIKTGAWPWMWDVLLNWNWEYYQWTVKEFDNRLSMVIMYFSPWSLGHYIAIPLGLYALVRSGFWRLQPTTGESPIAMNRALLAALYLGWLTQATLLQKSFHYSHAPVILLMLTLLTAYRWPVCPIFIGWCVIGGTLNHYRETSASFAFLNDWKEQRPNTYQQLIPRHRLLNDDWRSVYVTCLRHGSSPEIKEHLSFYRYIHCAPTWTDLDEARRFLQTLSLQDGELVCWDDSTHPLYIDLDIRPSFRFMHVNTSLGFRSKRPIIREELIASNHKYVVSDIAVSRYLYDWYSTEPPDGQPLGLPVAMPDFMRDVYPWNQPVIFKAGRYWVHRVENPINEIRIPYPAWANQP